MTEASSDYCLSCRSSRRSGDSMRSRTLQPPATVFELNLDAFFVRVLGKAGKGSPSRPPYASRRGMSQLSSSSGRSSLSISGAQLSMRPSDLPLAFIFPPFVLYLWKANTFWLTTPSGPSSPPSFPSDTSFTGARLNTRSVGAVCPGLQEHLAYFVKLLTSPGEMQLSLIIQLSSVVL